MLRPLYFDVHINEAARGIHFCWLLPTILAYDTHRPPHKGFKSAEIKFVQNQDATVERHFHANYSNQPGS